MPLKNRTNIVLTGNRDYQVKGAIVVHSMEELLEELKKYNSEQIYVIGGDSVYRQMLPYCDVAHITRIDHAYEADAYFPNLDEMEDWYIAADSDEQTYFDLEYQFLCTKERRSKRQQFRRKWRRGICIEIIQKQCISEIKSLEAAIRF